MIVLGIDSASCSGWALLDGCRPIKYGTINAREPARIDTLAALVNSIGRPDLVAIEDSYLGENVNTVKVLSRIQGRFEQAFATRGIPTELVMADVWQKALLTGLITGKSESADRKRAAIIWVRATYGVAVSEDIADAIGIGTWVIRREQLNRKLVQMAGAIPAARIHDESLQRKRLR
jgi:Holliday junction resolvasome RuvABC endonuclease subunit